MMNIFFIIFILFGLATIFPPIFCIEYQECLKEYPVCNNVDDLLKYVSKCIGIVVCYQSLLTNPSLFDNFKFSHEFEIKKGNNYRLCDHCIKTGQCKEYVKGKKLEWNGLKLYFYQSSKTLELEMDFFGNSYSQNFTGTTPSDFLELIGNGNQKILSLKDKNPEKNSAIDSLYLDLFFYFEKYDLLKDEGRKVYVGLHGLEECEEEEREINVQTQPDCSYYTRGESHFDKYRCFCGNTSEAAKDINKCCYEHNVCLKKNKGCPSPPLKYYKEFDTSKYELDVSLFENDNKIQCMDQPSLCNYNLCECDRLLIECWEGLITPTIDVCEACFRDDARVIAKKPIEKVVGLRPIFAKHEVKVLNVTKLVVNNQIEINAKAVNSTILDASFEVRNGYQLAAESELMIFKIIESKQDLLKHDINNATLSANNFRKNEARKYLKAAEYKFLIIELASAEYYKEKFASYEAGDYVLQKVERLAEIIEEKSEGDF